MGDNYVSIKSWNVDGVYSGKFARQKIKQVGIEKTAVQDRINDTQKQLVAKEAEVQQVVENIQEIKKDLVTLSTSNL